MSDTRFDIVKMSDLPESKNLSDSDIVLKDDGITTKKFKLSTLIQFIKNHTEISSFFVHQSKVNSADGIAPLDSEKKIFSSNIRYGKTIGTVYSGLNGAELENTFDNHFENTDIHLTSEEHVNVTDAIDKKHIHTNDIVLDKFTEIDGILNFDGNEIGVGGSEYVHPKPARADTSTNSNVGSGGNITVIDSIKTNTEGHCTGINLKTVNLPDVYNKATNDAKGNEIINQKTSSTEPTNQKVGDYWVKEY